MRITHAQLRKIVREYVESSSLARDSRGPAHLRLQRALREADETASTGAEVKGGATVDKAEALLKKIPGLEAVLKQVDTKNEIAALIQAIVDYTIQTGGVDQAEVLGALNVALTAAKKTSA